MNCVVCCESFNKSNHACVKCPFCDFDVCTSCSERYLCDTAEDAHCMNCRKGWTREILVDNFTQKFVSRTYKERRENLLFEREKSLMPATQPYVEIQKEIRSLQTPINKLATSIHIENEKYMKIANQPLGVLAVEHGLTSEFRASIVRHKLANEQQKVITLLRIDQNYLIWVQETLKGHLEGNQVEREKRQFVRACPFENCKGFLSTVWKCGMCENWACPECHEVKGPNKDSEHTCNPDNVATAQLLAKDSRNCPKCASLIFKINGCDQMYCTQCHTAFSWRTGRVETGQIHNPHYYEYARMRGTLARNPGDIPCGGFPDYYAIRGFLRNIASNTVLYGTILNAHRAWGHMEWFAHRYNMNENDNRDLRISLMIGDLSEDEFKKKIQQREKARQRKTDIRQVIEMLRAVLLDLFQDFAQTKNTDTLYLSLCELQKHYNETLQKVSKRYSNCAVPSLIGNFSTP